MKLNDNNLAKVDGGTVSSNSIDKNCTCLNVTLHLRYLLNPISVLTVANLKKGNINLNSHLAEMLL